MAEFVKLCTTWCGKIIAVAKNGEKTAGPRSGLVIHKKMATFGPHNPRVRTLVAARAVSTVCWECSPYVPYGAWVTLFWAFFGPQKLCGSYGGL